MEGNVRENRIKRRDSKNNNSEKAYWRDKELGRDSRHNRRTHHHHHERKQEIHHWGRSRSREKDKHRQSKERSPKLPLTKKNIEETAGMFLFGESHKTSASPNQNENENENEEENKNEEEKKVEKEKPCFEPSGVLAEETNTFNGVVLKYTEPLDAKEPTNYWRLYPFKGEEELDQLHIHRQTSYLLGRDRNVADVPLDHPSCSMQHGVIQFREFTYTNHDGRHISTVKPYILDLESTNKTRLNGSELEGARYYELRDNDVINFGFSTRDYVLVNGGQIKGSQRKKS